MQQLNTLTFPLDRAALIEASAGTGKTYTIVNIYLRLVLGHKCKPLTVDQILVVTFTNAATAELKTRVRQRLQQAYLAFYQAYSDDEFIQSLIDEVDDIELGQRRLALATKQMDEAAIYTIHGFCQRVLTKHAFESGSAYEQQLVLDESEWLTLATQDYWRKQVSPLPESTLALVLDLFATPDALQAQIAPLLYRRAQYQQSLSLSQVLQAIDGLITESQAAKDYFLSAQIDDRLLNADLNARSKLGKADFLRQVRDFCEGEAWLANFDKAGWALFSVEAVQKARKKTSKSLDDIHWERFERLAEQQQALQSRLKQALLQDAITQVAIELDKHKRQQNLLAPDDLLSQLAAALSSPSQLQQKDTELEQEQQDHTAYHPSQNALIEAIQNTYPAALIDEFQDTDPVQFSIFKSIYAPVLLDDSDTPDIAGKSLCWIMIGDPKQAIYAFRGADIFTYIQAKQLLAPEQHFTLDTNWRTQAALVAAVNRLFLDSPGGFLLSDLIQYQDVQAARENVQLSLNGQIQSPLQLHQLCSDNDQPLSWSQAQRHMAQHMAEQVQAWLSPANQASLSGKSISAGDCCVLVRDRLEADLIKSELDRLGIPSVFLARKSVFATQTAYDLYLLMQAMLNPLQERGLKSALLSEMFCFSGEEIDQLFNHESRWQTCMQQLYDWHQLWQRGGVMLALEQALSAFSVQTKLVRHYVDGMRRLSDLRHLLELLQAQQTQMPGESQLFSWFEQRIAEPDHNSESQQIRLESDADLVQIITQHASKGLEFPLVFIPFASRYKAAKQALYHEQARLLLDLSAQQDNLDKADRERLAEDMRLLYVAITRAKYLCVLGIWNNAHAQRRKSSEWRNTAIGQLLHLGDAKPSDGAIAERAQAFVDAARSDNVEVELRQLRIGDDLADTYAAIGAETTPVQPQAQAEPQLSVASLSRSVERNWRLTSYSAIAREAELFETDAPGLDEGRQSINALDAEHSTALEQARPPQQSIYHPYHFVRGAQAGSFLHAVLENIDFQQPDNLQAQIETQGNKYAIAEDWFAMLADWLSDVLKCQWQKGETLALAQLEQVLVEMEFHLPLKKVDAKPFSQLVGQFVSTRQREYQFSQLTGMLKGFIDLTFEYQGKFYVADYKSNHLGDTPDAYAPSSLEQAMLEHDYHLQALLYVLALHRYLRQRLPDYDYQQHIGGAYYLFLRGMQSDAPGQGVYHCLPEYALIEKLDALFAGEWVDTTMTSKSSRDRQALGEYQQGSLF